MNQVHIHPPLRQGPLRNRLAVQVRLSLEFWPADEIALILDEGTGRLAVVRGDGRLAHRVPPLPPGGPWVAVSPSAWAHPRYLRTPGDPLWFPGGWTMPRPSPAAEKALLEHAACEPAPEEGFVLGATGVLSHEVLWLEERRGRGVWVTAAGALDSGARLDRAALWHPDLVRLGRRHLNLQNLEALHLPTEEAAATRGERIVVFTGGLTLPLVADAARTLCRVLHVPVSLQLLTSNPSTSNPSTSEPQTSELRTSDRRIEALFRWGLRDFPGDLTKTSPAHLKRWFAKQPRELVANLLWQRVRHRRQMGTQELSEEALDSWVHIVVLPALQGLEGVTAWSYEQAETLTRELLDQLTRLDRLFELEECGLISTHKPLAR